LSIKGGDRNFEVSVFSSSRSAFNEARMVYSDSSDQGNSKIYSEHLFWMVFGEELVMFLNQGDGRNFDVSGFCSSMRAFNQVQMVFSDSPHQGDSNTV